VSRVVALGSGVMLGLMIVCSDAKTDWTPPYLIVMGIVAVVCLGALVCATVESHGETRAVERIVEGADDE
jgi:hypothetical protein